MSKRDNNLKSQAVKLTILSESRFKIGAILANKSYRAAGMNDMGKTHPNTAAFDARGISSYGADTRASVHAEQRVLTKSTKSAGGTLYVARVTLTNELALARPCDMCYTLIQDAGVKQVIYSIGENEWGEYYV